MSDQVAILTGDLRESTAKSSAATDTSLGIIAGLADDIARWTSAPTRFTRFRGDGWQIVLGQHWLALRTVIITLARLRGQNALTTRLAIGLGKMDREGSADLSDAAGEALVASGRALDAMPKTRLLAIAGPSVTGLHHVPLPLIEDRARRWTREQAEATALWLEPDNPTLDNLSRHLGITSQAVSQRLRGAGAQSFRQALKAWEDHEEWREVP